MAARVDEPVEIRPARAGRDDPGVVARLQGCRCRDLVVEPEDPSEEAVADFTCLPSIEYERYNDEARCVNL